MKPQNLICIVATILLFSCSTKKNNEQKIVVSIPPQKYVVEQLVGDDIPVRTILDSNSNPEIFEPTMSTMLDLMGSKVYFMVGTLDFEEKLSKSALEKRENLSVVNTSEGMKLLYGTHDHCDHHEHSHDHSHSHKKADPHVWSTPSNMKIMANNMASKLYELYPDRKDNINRNLLIFNNKMDSLDTEFHRILEEANSKDFMVWHPSYSYLADQYGMTQIAVGSNAKENSVKELTKRIDLAKKSNVKVLFIQKEFDPAQASAIADRDSVKLVAVNPMDGDWESEFNRIISAFQ